LILAGLCDKLPLLYTWCFLLTPLGLSILDGFSPACLLDEPSISEEDQATYLAEGKDCGSEEEAEEGETRIVCVSGINVAFPRKDAAPFGPGGNSVILLQLVWDSGVAWETLDSLYSSSFSDGEFQFQSFCRLFLEGTAGGLWHSESAGPPIATPEEIKGWTTTADIVSATRRAVEGKIWLTPCLLDFMAAGGATDE
jgi:hypothetical protein